MSRSRTDPRARGAGAPDRGAEAALLVAWAWCVALALSRATLAFAPGMGAWGLDLQRALDPVWAWLPWLVAAAAVVPPLARRALPGATALGEWIARRPVRAGVVLAALAAGLVGAFPDRLRFVGDFLLRQGSAGQAIAPARVYPQALPLDVLLHFTLPRALAGSIGPDAAARVVGAAGAAALAIVAIAFARTCGLRGVAALVAVCAALLGGWIALFTGYAKAFGPLAVLTAALAVAAMRVARDGRGFVALGASLALALALHRSALALVPGAALALALGWRRAQGAQRAWRVVAALLPAGVLAVLAPRLLATLTGVDVAVHLAPAATRSRGLLASAFAPARLADVGNLALQLAPLAMLLPAFALLRPAAWRSRETVVLGALAIPFAVGAFAVHPAQGMFRDWDDFAAPAMAVSMLATWLACEALAAAPRLAWVGVGLAAAIAIPAVQSLRLHSDLARGLARVEAFAAGPPAREAHERGQAWDFLGVRYAQLERWDDAARALARAAADTPSPRVMLQWAMAEEARGHLETAREAYRGSLEREPGDPMAWTGLAGVALRLGDTTEVARASAALERLAPGTPAAREVRAALDRMRFAGSEAPAGEGGRGAQTP
jgi:tetratricopeptide (TPR) repeat protein